MHTQLLLMPAGIVFKQLKGLKFLFWYTVMMLRSWYPGSVELPECYAILLMSRVET